MGGAERGFEVGDRVVISGFDDMPVLNGWTGDVHHITDLPSRPGTWYTVTFGKDAIDGFWTVPESCLALIDPAPQPSEGE